MTDTVSRLKELVKELFGRSPRRDEVQTMYLWETGLQKHHYANLLRNTTELRGGGLNCVMLILD